MLKIVSLLFYLCIPITTFCQNEFSIKGKFIENIQSNDSVFLYALENFDNAYYEQLSFTSGVNDNNFSIKGKISYPQLYKIRLKSESDRIPGRGGFYFIDEKASTMVIDPIHNLTEINSKTGSEFKQKFIPYFINNNSGHSDNQDNLLNSLINPSNEFESKLLSYVNEHSNSYVALWFLIARLNYTGYSTLQEKTLYSFSTEIKLQKLWKVAETNFHNIRIRKNTKFPELPLKNVDFNNEKLKVGKGEYTLIDFWFSRCMPCLAQIPALKSLYNTYHNKGFNIIGISTDLTKDAKSYWQRRIIEKEIPWKNYLDENAREATQEKIFLFPTNFLLNKNGEVVEKNISLENLRKFLLINLPDTPTE